MLESDTRGVVKTEIRELLMEFSEEEVVISGEDGLTDLGMNSLTLARLIIQLEKRLGVDPFAAENAAISDARTVDDLVEIYRRTLEITKTTTKSHS